MLGRLIGIFSDILAVVILAFAIWNKKHRKLWIVTLVLVVVASVFVSMVPIENLFYSFPSAEAVAKYACKGKVVEILAGEESSLILYSEEPEAVSYMLSNKTDGGYKIGTNLEMNKHSHVISAPYTQIQISESTHAIDKYVYIFGIIEGKDVVITDTQGNNFFVFQESSSQAGTEGTLFTAFCILNNTEYETYAITVNSTTTEEQFFLQRQEDGSSSLTEFTRQADGSSVLTDSKKGDEISTNDEIAK